MTENQKQLWNQLTNLILYAKSLLGADYEVDFEELRKKYGVMIGIDIGKLRSELKKEGMYPGD